MKLTRFLSKFLQNKGALILQTSSFIQYCLPLLHLYQDKHKNFSEYLLNVAKNIKIQLTPPFQAVLFLKISKHSILFHSVNILAVLFNLNNLCFSQYMVNLFIHSIINMGNKNISGLSSVITKNWQPSFDGADTYLNKLTLETIREQVIKIQAINNFQDLKFRMKETNPYICRVVFYSHYIHNLYYVFTEQSRNKPVVKNLGEWEIHQKNIISAFMELAERYGPTRVCREMIGVDNNGQIKVWINPNTALCEVLCPCQTREMMLEDIKMILEQISRQLKYLLLPCMEVKSLELKDQIKIEKIALEVREKGQRNQKGLKCKRDRLNWMKYGRNQKTKKLDKINNKIKQISQKSEKSLDSNKENERKQKQKQRDNKSSSLISNPEGNAPHKYQKSYVSQLKSLAHHRTKSLTQNAFKNIVQGRQKPLQKQKKSENDQSKKKKSMNTKRVKDQNFQLNEGKRHNEKLKISNRETQTNKDIESLSLCIHLKQGRWENILNEQLLEKELNELFEENREKYRQNYYQPTKVF